MPSSLITKFLQTYANLPFAARQEIVAVVDGQPFTWNAILPEVQNKTSLGEELLDQLISLEIIKNDQK